MASSILEGKLFHFLIILLAEYLFLTSVLVCLVKSLYEWPLVCVIPNAVEIQVPNLSL